MHAQIYIYIEIHIFDAYCFRIQYNIYIYVYCIDMFIYIYTYIYIRNIYICVCVCHCLMPNNNVKRPGFQEIVETIMSQFAKHVPRKALGDSPGKGCGNGSRYLWIYQWPKWDIWLYMVYVWYIWLIYIYMIMYIIYLYMIIWVNYNYLTATEPWKSLALIGTLSPFMAWIQVSEIVCFSQMYKPYVKHI